MRWSNAMLQDNFLKKRIFEQSPKKIDKNNKKIFWLKIKKEKNITRT